MQKIPQEDDSNLLLSNLSKPEIPSLYGLRGVAALAVVIWHYLVPWNLSYLFPGPFAVTLFFELSGLLITWLLLKEMGESGTLATRQFYLRRALRLFPVFYAVWILCRLAGPFDGSWASFFYMGDYYQALTKRYNILTVAWSLGVEEKFYLLWPFILARMAKPKLVSVLAAVLILEPVYRSVLSLLGHQTYTWFAFDAHLDAIVLGCMVAIFASRGWAPPQWLAHPATPICALILVFLLQKLPDLVIYLLAIILVSVICRPTAFLNNPVARYFGAISYSLYLSHTYACEVLWPRIFGHLQWHNVTALLISQLAVAIALASALHFAVEQPFLTLKSRFRLRTPSRRLGFSTHDEGKTDRPVPTCNSRSDFGSGASGCEAPKDSEQSHGSAARFAAAFLGMGRSR